MLKVLASLRHPGIAHIIDVIRTQAGLQLVQTYCAAGPLSASLPLSSADPRRGAEVFVKICDAVAYMHSRGIIHGDLKLGNILHSDSGDPMLIDFDHCRFLRDTRSENFFGTPGYMAPELIQQTAAAGVLTDVYALGVILCELLSGELKSESISAAELLAGKTLDLRLNRPNLWRRRDWNAIVQTATHPEASQRYSSVKMLSEDVQSLINDRPIAARQTSRFERLTRWASKHQATSLLCAAAICVAVVGVSGSLITWNHASQTRTRAENGQLKLQQRISETQQAQMELETLVTQVRAVLDAARIAEERQQELTISAQNAQQATQAAVAKSEQLALELEAALEQATAGQTAVEKLETQKTAATGELDVMRTKRERSKYLRTIQQVRAAIAEKQWSVALELLASTEESYRGIEYPMLKNAATNKLQQPICVVIGTRSWRGFGGTGKYYYHGIGYELTTEEEVRSLRHAYNRSGSATFGVYDGQREILEFSVNYEFDGTPYHRLLGVLDSEDLLLRGLKKGSQHEIVIATFAPQRYQESSRIMTNEEWEALTKRIASVPERRTAVRTSEARTSPARLAFEEDDLNQITGAVWQGSRQPLRNLGPARMSVSILPNHSISVGSYCQGISISKSGVLAFIDRAGRLVLIDLQNKQADLELTNQLSDSCGFGNVTSDSNDLCYVDLGRYGPNPLFQSAVTHVGSSTPRQSQQSPAVINDIQASWSTSIPIWFDPNSLYVSRGLRIDSFALPISPASQKSEWFRLDLDGREFFFQNTLLLSKHRVLASIGKRVGDDARTYRFATLLFDRELQGFNVLDRVLDACTMTPDGKMILFADQDGYLKQFELQFDQL